MNINLKKELLQKQELVLEKIKIKVAKRLSEEGLNYMAVNLDTFIRQKENEVIFDFITFMLGLHKETIDIEESWPESWLEAFRERWFPKFWLKKYPIKKKKISVHQRIFEAVCPHIAIKSSDEHFQKFYFTFEGYKK